MLTDVVIYAWIISALVVAAFIPIAAFWTLVALWQTAKERKAHKKRALHGGNRHRADAESINNNSYLA